MPTIPRRLPFYADATTLRIPSGPAIKIMHDQIVVWLSVAPTAQPQLPASARRFPALIDLGFNGSFLLREDHVSQWAGVEFDEEKFPFLGTYQAYGHDIASFVGDVWLHANVPGFRDQVADTRPFCLEMIKGISVCPASMSQIRLPLIGLQALRKNRLRLLVNGEKRYMSLRAPLQKEDSPTRELP